MADTLVALHLNRLEQLLTTSDETSAPRTTQEERIRQEVAAILAILPELSEPDQQEIRAALYQMGVLADRRGDKSTTPPSEERREPRDTSRWLSGGVRAAASMVVGTLKSITYTGEPNTQRPQHSIDTVADRLGLREDELNELIAGQISPLVARRVSGVASSPANLMEFINGHHGTGLIQITGLPPDELGELARRLGPQGAIGFLIGLLVAQSKQAMEGNLVNREALAYQQTIVGAQRLQADLQAFLQQVNMEE